MGLARMLAGLWLESLLRGRSETLVPVTYHDPNKRLRERPPECQELCHTRIREGGLPDCRNRPIRHIVPSCVT